MEKTIASAEEVVDHTYNKVNDNVNLGKVLKEGIINAQDKFEEWVQCYVVVRERGLTLGFHTDDKKEKNAVDDVIFFSSFEEIEIEMLPDNARRSRESKLFPFAVRRKIEMVQTVTTSPDDNEENQLQQHTKSCLLKGTKKIENSQDVIFATLNGREMWEWASTIRWLGTKPAEEYIPNFGKPSTTMSHCVYYENPLVLQNVLLKMFTYNNLPVESVKYVEINSGYFELYSDVNDFSDDEHSDEEKENDLDESSQSICESSQSIRAFKNRSFMFGAFAYNVIVGACVQVNEKCFELITSAKLFDLSSGGREYNSILSMLCEGDYSTSREYLVKSLWKQGYPKLAGYYACYEAFTMNLAKPGHCSGISSPTGRPVHPDDQKLCRIVRYNGDGEIDNATLYKQLIEASNGKVTEFESQHLKRITALEFPQSSLSWGRSYLTRLNLTNNAILELPDELFEFSNLVHLNLSRNCLLGISHKLGNLTNLESLNVSVNLITELPYTIANLENVTDFSCHFNPITKPPCAVWSRGISNTRNFFKDMEGGTEVNVDLRVLVLGLSEVGKTSLINGLIDSDTTALTRVGDRTVGIEKRTWVLDRTAQQPVNLLVYDFAGQEEYYITHHLFLGSRALYVLAFDLSKFEDHLLDHQILLWWNSIQDRVCNVKSNDSITPKVIIVGTKADLINNAECRADYIHKKLEEHFQLRLKGVNDRLKVLEKKLKKLDPRRRDHKNDKNKKEYESLPNTKKMEILSKENEQAKLHHQLQCTIVLPEKIHAISSVGLLNFDKLKEQIASSLREVGPSGKYFPQLDEELPSSWFQVRKFVRDQSSRKGRECMKLSQYFQLLSDELNINEDVGRRATQFCHELGDVLFFEKEDLVFLCPSFLIDVFKLVIRHDHKESTYWREEMMEKLQIGEEMFNRGKELLLQKGEIEEWLLIALWSQLDDVDLEFGIINNLIQLLETFDVATYIKHKGQKRFFIPEFQPKLLKVPWQKNKKEGQFEAQRYVCVDSNLPHGLLKRVQVRVLKKIFKRNGAKEFHLAQNQFCIMDINSTLLYFESGKGSEDCPGFGKSEGIKICISGSNKENVMNLLKKVYNCVEDTLKEYPGRIFDHYVVYASKYGGAVFLRLEELKEKQRAKVKKIKVTPKQSVATGNSGQDSPMKKSSKIKSMAEEYVDIDNLIPVQVTTRKRVLST